MTPSARIPWPRLVWSLRVVAAAGLAFDAVVHLRLASDYQLIFPQGIGGGALFRIEAVVAIIAAVAVLASSQRRGWVPAVLVAGSALMAVVLNRYVEIPAVGPLPSMYEPLWFLEKTASAVAEGIAAVAAATAWALAPEARRTTTRHVF